MSESEPRDYDKLLATLRMTEDTIIMGKAQGLWDNLFARPFAALNVLIATVGHGARFLDLRVSFEELSPEDQWLLFERAAIDLYFDREAF